MVLSTTFLHLLLLLTVCYGHSDDHDPYPKRPGSRKPVPALYNQRYSEQTFIGTHDAAALRTEENGYSLSGNQYFNISTQLNSGVRVGDAHSKVQHH